MRRVSLRRRQLRFGTYGCVVAIGLAVACDALWVGDTPRPTLADEDYLCVSPVCPTLTIDPNAIAGVEPIITITARRRETKLGAESVPVDVSIGSCAAPRDASAGDDGQVVIVAQDDAGSILQCNAPNASSVCTSGLQQMDSARVAAFALVGTKGCRETSTTELNCTLDANGQASFRVRSASANSQTLLFEYLPICVRPAMLNPTHARDTEVRLVPREGTARFATAIAALADLPQPGPDGGTCASLSDCKTSVPRGRFSAGVINADTPTRPTREDDFLPLQRDVVLSVAITPATSDAFLTMSSTCTGADGGATADGGAIDVPLERRQLGSAPFLLCGLPTSSAFQVAAKLVAAEPDGGTGSSFESRRLDVTAPVVVQAYGVASDGRIVVTTCDGTTAPARSSAFKSVTPAQTLDNDTIVVSCRADGGGVNEAGADAGTNTPCPVNLNLATGGACAL